MHPYITLEDTQLPSISFHKHCNYVSDSIDKRNNMLKVLAGSSWGQDKKTLLMTYNALEKYIANYAAPVWSTNASDSSFKKIQTAQNAALRTETEAHKMDSIDYIHQESLTLSQGPLSHGITIQEPRPRPMRETPLQTSLNCSS